MKYLLLSFLFLIAVAIGCGEEGNKTPIIKEFRGIYIARDTTIVVDAQKKDSLILSIRDNRTYAILFYDVSLTDFCNCEGNIFNFGSNNFTFSPTKINFNNCDTLRIPKGDFIADYISHGDTIYFEQRINDSLFRFILLD